MSATEPPSAPSLIPEVQGLRAFSVIAVVLFHMGWLWCGWMGVWVFFVISGFVITRSLMGSRAATWRAALKQFYVSRAARILPLYLTAILVAVVSLYGQALLYREPEGFRFLADLPWLLTGLYNIHRALPGYEHTELFGHFWSLAVEEQFYLFFPLAFLLLSRRALATVLAVLVAFGPLIRLGCHLGLERLGWSAGEVGNAVYQLSFNHFDAFAIGCLIALGEGRIRALKGTRIGLGIVWTAPALVAALAVGCIVWTQIAAPAEGAAVLTAPWVVAPNTLPGQLLAYAFANAAAGTALLWVLLEVPVASFLRRDFLVRIGTLSFGVYIWHFPLLWIFSLAGVRSWEGAAAYAIGVWAAATLSYNWLERPAMGWIKSAGWRRLGLTIGSPTSDVRSPVRP